MVCLLWCTYLMGRMKTSLPTKRGVGEVGGVCFNNAGSPHLFSSIMFGRKVSDGFLYFQGVSWTGHLEYEARQTSKFLHCLLSAHNQEEVAGVVVLDGYLTVILLSTFLEQWASIPAHFSFLHWNKEPVTLDRLCSWAAGSWISCSWVVKRVECFTITQLWCSRMPQLVAANRLPLLLLLKSQNRRHRGTVGCCSFVVPPKTLVSCSQMDCLCLLFLLNRAARWTMFPPTLH